MTPDDARELIGAVRRVCPRQQIPDTVARRWAGLLSGLRPAECLVAVGALGPVSREITPEMIRGRVETIRRNRQAPTGAIYREAVARRGGREYEGGPVAWDAEPPTEPEPQGGG